MFSLSEAIRIVRSSQYLSQTAYNQNDICFLWLDMIHNWLISYLKVNKDQGIENHRIPKKLVTEFALLDERGS